MERLLRIAEYLDRIPRFAGKCAGWVVLPLIAVIMFDVITRKIDFLPSFEATSSVITSFQADAMAANVEDGVTNVQWSQDVLDALEEAWNEVITEEVASNEDSKRIWESITAFREKFKIWGDMAYLK